MTASPPPDLQASGRALWSDVLGAYEVHEGELRLLAEAARTLDELVALREALKGEPATVPGSTGQERAHPLYEELRRHRETLSKLLTALRIPYADEVEGVTPAVSAARRAAQARWGNGSASA